MEKKLTQTQTQTQKQAQDLIATKIGTFIGYLALSCFTVMLKIILAIVATLFIGLFFEDIILNIFFQLGVKNIKLWQVGLCLSFATTFFGISILKDKKVGILSTNTKKVLLKTLEVDLNYAVYIIYKPFLGALYGLVVGIFFEKAITTMASQVGIIGVVPWQLGVFIAFIGSFFTHFINSKKPEKS